LWRLPGKVIERLRRRKALELKPDFNRFLSAVRHGLKYSVFPITI
jgi:hypothetical protein